MDAGMMVFLEGPLDRIVLDSGEDKKKYPSYQRDNINWVAKIQSSILNDLYQINTAEKSIAHAHAQKTISNKFKNLQYHGWRISRLYLNLLGYHR